MCTKMWKKTLVIVTIILAVVIALLALFMPADKLAGVVIASRFFEVMLPVLAVGALLKYLTHCPVRTMWDTILPACTIFIAVVLAILALILQPSLLEFVLFFERFFEVMLPILAVGALLKFLTTHCWNHTEVKQF